MNKLLGILALGIGSLIAQSCRVCRYFKISPLHFVSPKKTKRMFIIFIANISLSQKRENSSQRTTGYAYTAGQIDRRGKGNVIITKENLKRLADGISLG